MKSFIKLIALMLCVCMCVASFAGCNEPNNNNSTGNSSNANVSGTNSSPSKEDGAHPADVMFDNNLETCWTPTNKESETIEFSLKEEKTFNSIQFVEEKDKVSECFIEIKQGDEWVEIFHSDEMGNRITILDKSYTAKDMRLTVTMLELSGIAEISFEERGRIAGTNNFRTLGYYTASRIEWARETNFDELKGVTDLILFDFGSWDKNGNFIWSEKYNEEFLKQTIEELDEVLGGRKVNLWFCLQNYHKASTNHTKELFATEASIKKLTQFSIDICKKYGFVGVDIDYEYPSGDEAWANYDKFLNYAAKELHKNGFMLSAAMLPGMKTTVTPETAALMDYVNIMSYDLHGRDVGRRRHAPYAVCEYSLKYFTDLGFKPEQLLLGLPYYMHFNDGTTSSGDGGYKKTIGRWRDAIKPWMNVATTPSGVYDFNGPEMIKDKTYFAMLNGMSGVFNWVVGSDVSHSDPRSLSLSVMNTIARFKSK